VKQWNVVNDMIADNSLICGRISEKKLTSSMNPDSFDSVALLKKE
jgi:hypothetical protein